MRRGAILGVLALFFGLFGASSALATHSDTVDGNECREQTDLIDPDADGLGITSGEESEEDDRAAACVSAGGVVIFYIGGTTSDKDGNACGAIIVADQTVAGSSDWGAEDEEGEPTEPEDQGLLEQLQDERTTAQDNPHCEVEEE